MKQLEKSQQKFHYRKNLLLKSNADVKNKKQEQCKMIAKIPKPFSQNCYINK